MQVYICAQLFDPDGVVSIDALPFTDQGDTRRRANRVATLDGGAAINDFGYSEADRTIELRWSKISSEDERNLDRIVRVHPRVTLSTRQGVYLCVPESYSPGRQARLVLLVIEKLSEA